MKARTRPREYRVEGINIKKKKMKVFREQEKKTLAIPKTTFGHK